jgi:hypothetical protein
MRLDQSSDFGVAVTISLLLSIILVCLEQFRHIQ